MGHAARVSALPEHDPRRMERRGRPPRVALPFVLQWHDRHAPGRRLHGQYGGVGARHVSTHIGAQQVRTTEGGLVPSFAYTNTH